MARRKPDPKALKLVLRAFCPGAADAFDRVWALVLEPMCILWFPPAAADDGDSLDEDNPMRDVLERCWKAIQGKNDWLREKYLDQPQRTEAA